MYIKNSYYRDANHIKYYFTFFIDQTKKFINLYKNAYYTTNINNMYINKYQNVSFSIGNFFFLCEYRLRRLRDDEEACALQYQLT